MPRSSGPGCWALLGCVLAAGFFSANATGWATIQGTITMGKPSYLGTFLNAHPSDLKAPVENAIAKDASAFVNATDMSAVPRFLSFYPIVEPDMPLAVSMALTVKVPDAEDNDAAANTVQAKLENGTFMTAADLNSRLADQGFTNGDYIASIDVEAKPAETVQLTWIAEMKLADDETRASVVGQPEGSDDAKAALTQMLQEAIDNVDLPSNQSSCCVTPKGSVTATNLFNKTGTEVFVLSNIEVQGGVRVDMPAYDGAASFVNAALQEQIGEQGQGEKTLIGLFQNYVSSGIGGSIDSFEPLATVPGQLYTGSGSGYTTAELQMTVADSSVRSDILDKDSALRTRLERGLEGIMMMVPALSLKKMKFMEGSEETSLIGRFAVEVTGPESNAVAAKVLGDIVRSNNYNLTADKINEALGTDYNNTITEVTKIAGVPGQYGEEPAILTLEGRFEMGDPSYLSLILDSEQVQQRAKNVLDGLIASVLDFELPMFKIEDTYLSSGENSTIDLFSKVVVSIPATTDTASTRDLLYELLTYADLTTERLNKQFNEVLQEPSNGPYVSRIKDYNVEKGNTTPETSGDENVSDVDVSNGEATLYMTLVHGSAAYRTSLFNSSDKVSELETGVKVTIEDAMEDANVKNVNITEGGSADETDIMVVMTVEGTMNNSAARSQLREFVQQGNTLTASNVNSLFVQQYGEAPGEAAWVTDITNIEVETGSEEGSTTVSADLSGVGFNETDYTEKTSDFMEFKTAFVEDMKDWVSSECGCVPDVRITDVEFVSKRRSLLDRHEVTVTATVSDADPADVDAAMSNLSSQGGTLGGATVVNVDVQDDNEDDGAIISHLSAACLALVLSVVAALAA